MSMHADDEHLKEGSPCPLCGEPLVIRHSAHGDFLGCSNLLIFKTYCWF